MTNSQHLFAEFESLGEIEVNSRVERKVYDGPTRAYAMRWLNDRAIERAVAYRPDSNGRQMSLQDITRKAQGVARAAMIVAAIAIAAASLAAWAAYEALHTARVAADRAQVLAASAATPAPIPVRHRHRAP
jgi:hypothetical protein